jgi:hypothetical protein
MWLGKISALACDGINDHLTGATGGEGAAGAAAVAGDVVDCASVELCSRYGSCRLMGMSSPGATACFNRASEGVALHKRNEQKARTAQENLHTGG